LGALRGVDPRDPATRTVEGGSGGDYTSALDKNGLRGARIGIVRKSFGFNSAVDALMENAIGEMKRLGAILVDPADLPRAGTFDDSELVVLLYEFKTDLNRYLSDLGTAAPVRSLKEIIAFN